VVLGIFRDTPGAQAKFSAQYNLPYTLLADVDGKVSKQFVVLKEKNMRGRGLLASLPVGAQVIL